MKVIFGNFTLDTSTGELWRGNASIRLAPQPSRLLVMLVERKGLLLTREEIRQQLWDQDTFVDFDQSLNACIRQIRACLRDNADKPIYIETLPRRGYRFIAEVSTVDVPELPSESLQEKPLVLAQPAPVLDLPADSLPQPRRRFSPSAMIAAGLLVVCVVAVLLYYRTIHRRRVLAVESSAAVHVRPAVAVFGFRNEDGQQQDAWLSPALSEMLANQMSTDDHFRIVPASDMAHVKSDLNLKEAEDVRPESWRALKQAAGADMLIHGSYSLSRRGTTPQVSLHVEVDNLDSQQHVASFEETDDLAHLSGLVSKAEKQAMATMLPGQHVVDDPNSLASMSSNEDALRYYAEGLEQLRGYDAQSARSLFERAIGIDPQFAMAYADLADALGELGYIEKAKVEAAKAFELSRNLPRIQRLSIEARYRDINGEDLKAIEIYKALFTFYPDEADWGLDLARLQGDNSERQDSLNTLAEVRKLPLTPSEEVNAYNQEAVNILVLADRSASQEYRSRLHQVIEKEIDFARKRGGHLVVGSALRTRCALEIYNESQAPVMAACEEARSIFRAVGNLQAVAAMTNNIAIMFQRQNRFDEAIQGFEQARRVYHDAENFGDEAAMLDNLTLLHEHRGDLAEVVRGGDELSRAHDTETDDEYHFEGLYSEAVGYLDEGKLDQAQAVTNRAEEVAGKQSNPAQKRDNTLSAIYLLSEIALDHGDNTLARKLADKGRALTGKDATVDLAVNALQEADIDNAENHASEATANALRNAMKAFAGSDDNQDLEMQAGIDLVYQELAMGHAAEAGKVIAQLQPLEAQDIRAETRLRLLLAQASLQRTLNHSGDAMTLAAREVEMAKAKGFLYYELEGEILLSQWKQENGSQLTQQANRAGFHGLAARASGRLSI